MFFLFFNTGITCVESVAYSIKKNYKLSIKYGLFSLNNKDMQRNIDELLACLFV